MNFKFSTNFFLAYVRKKYGGPGSTGLDATPIVPIHTGHPVDWHLTVYKSQNSGKTNGNII